MNLQRKKVYDPILRLLHLTIGLSILGLLITGFYGKFLTPGPYRTAIWVIHIKIGYLLIASLAGRITWFLIGPKEAKLSALLHISIWKKLIKEKTLPSLSSNFGHDPLASIAYLGFYGMALLISVSGILMAGIDHGLGPFTSMLFDQLNFLDFLELPHLLLSIGISLFIFTHIVAIILHEKKDQLPISQAMISGYQYRKNKNPFPQENIK